MVSTDHPFISGINMQDTGLFYRIIISIEFVLYKNQRNKGRIVVVDAYSLYILWSNATRTGLN